ncbi:hypothetical protein FZEAL_3088 [Fusarium zealandicum]|uniref:Uncharacterized protein n=1 Tax=Fusarium zealandicum TaxID=1053134 RepID=A0A8H4UQ82_9HYPO|nr:hypothetical protein FZEAL_3088 [Fusarium zealandicum]
MLATPKLLSSPALRLWLLVSAATLFSLTLLSFYWDSFHAPLAYAQSKAIEYCDLSKYARTPTMTRLLGTNHQANRTPEVRNCSDPYRRPGYLYVPQNRSTNYNRTTYIPYSSDFLNAEDPETASYPTHGDEVIFNYTAPEPEFLNLKSNPSQWMQKAVRENRRRIGAMNLSSDIQKPETFLSMKDDAGLGWLWGRRVVMFSDSVERYMTQFFCEEFEGVAKFPITHVSARQAKVICDVPAFNLTLVYLHSPGSFTYKPNWWWIKPMEYVAWEERWDKHWRPHEEPIQGPNGRPDLILWQNGLWDQRAFAEGGKANHGPKHVMAKMERQIQWQEVRFVAGRIKKIAQRLNDEFGAGAPIMFRSLTTHRTGGMKNTILLDLDRLGRAVAEEAGHEIFEWARIITLFSHLFQDEIHPAKGPASWLWGNMVLEYLARSAGAQVGGESRAPYFDGWDACHPELLGWGGR